MRMGAKSGIPSLVDRALIFIEKPDNKAGDNAGGVPARIHFLEYEKTA